MPCFYFLIIIVIAYLFISFHPATARRKFFVWDSQLTEDFWLQDAVMAPSG